MIYAVVLMVVGCFIPHTDSFNRDTRYKPRIREFLHQGDSLFFAKEFEQAEQIYRKIISIDPKCVDAHIGIGRSINYFYSGGYYDENHEERMIDAQEEFRTAFTLDSSHARANFYYGESLAPWRNQNAEQVEEDSALDKSIYYMERALALDSSFAYPHLMLWAAYLMKEDVDKAEFQLREMMRKDYFPQAVLDFGYNLLVSADSGGIIFTNGDNDTYPLLCLQQAQGLRKDIRIVNLSLLNTSWYARIMRDHYGVPITYTDSVLDTLLFVFDATEHSFIPLSELLVRDISNTAARDEKGPPVYFSSTLSPSFRNRYLDNITQEGMLYRYRLEKLQEVDLGRFEENMSKYRFTLMNPNEVWEKNDSPITRSHGSILESGYSILHLDVARAWLAEGNKKKALDYCRKAYYISEGADPELTRLVLLNWLVIDSSDPELQGFVKDYERRYGDLRRYEVKEGKVKREK